VHAAEFDDAIALVDTDGPMPDPRVLDILSRAGRDLARAIGIVQAVANPSSWAVYGPYSLLAKGGAAGDAFLAALFEYGEFVSFKPYKESAVRRRPIVAGEGASGVALAALEHRGLARPETAGGSEESR
jgi:predicted NBD/HSP70 family sugar kinase